MPNVQGKTILIFGDSLSSGNSTPGGQLATQLRAKGAAVTVDALSGRSAYNYFWRESGDTKLPALAALRPRLVFVFLGTNDIGLNMTTDAKYMERIRKAFADVGAEVWAIGPPQKQDAEPVVAMEREVFGTGRFIDARPLSEGVERSPDGVHFTVAGSAELGKRLAAAIESAGGGWGWLVGVAALAGVCWWLS